MEPGLVDTQGYPVGSLYYMFRACLSAVGDGPGSLEFKSRRAILLSMGVPEQRIQSVFPQLWAIPLKPEMIGLPTDYDSGRNLPTALEG